MNDFCQCPPPATGSEKKTLFEYGRGWRISDDFQTWTCTVCGKVSPPEHVMKLARELAGSIPACEAIYRGEKA